MVLERISDYKKCEVACHIPSLKIEKGLKVLGWYSVISSLRHHFATLSAISDSLFG